MFPLYILQGLDFAEFLYWQIEFSCLENTTVYYYEAALSCWLLPEARRVGDTERAHRILNEKVNTEENDNL